MLADRLEPYRPTLRDKFARGVLNVLGDNYLARGFVENLTGSAGLGHSKNVLADYTGLTLPFASEEAGRKMGSGNMLGGAADLALSAVPIPAAGKVAQRVKQVLPKPKPKIVAYHGSPHKFDEFSMDKIGTGEGAQAYGRGLYFAENEGVARQYRDALAPDGAGHMYQVGINADPEHFLDWDAPVNQQSPHVRNALADVLGEDGLRAMPDPNVYDANRLPPPFDPRKGETVYRALGPKRQATQRLQEAGVSGIRYKDQGSRGVDGAQATRNYVVFNDKLVDIMKRYGVAAPVAAAMIASGRYDQEPGT